MQGIREEYIIRGTVQGVGFRPTVHKIATALGLSGAVQNRSDGVHLTLVGCPSSIAAFFSRIKAALPQTASIDEVQTVHRAAVDLDGVQAPFVILESESGDSYEVSIPPDVGICHECLRELFDPANRRYGYPFTTCAVCGPRYTVVEAMPYDRERTSMRAFPMCQACAGEYADTAGRRFHAESIACPQCGPVLSIAGENGVPIAVDPLQTARKLLSSGAIVSLRGIGGFLLALNAFDERAISKLRERKHRPDKPLAVMARNIEVVKRFCHLSSVATAQITSSDAPIVVLDVKDEARAQLPLHALAPDTETLGVMLPYSPLHHLLFHPLRGDPIPPFDLLVMSSGNRRSEPICIKNEEAFERLRGIADAFLIHEREITLRADDSLVTVQGDSPQVWRRARGIAPRSVHTVCSIAEASIGMGAELKNAIAVGWGNGIVLSPHVGDLETPEALAGLELVVSAFPAFLHKEPRRILTDLHPDMHSSVLGKKLAEKLHLPRIPVQHHYAHALSCMAEHGLEESLALVFDGLGLGTDGTIWGAELLHCTRSGFERLATFEGVPLPGGDAAVLDPRRQLFARLARAGVPLDEGLKKRLRLVDEEECVWSAQIRQSLNCPVTHAAGRLFDAVAVLLGASPDRVTYDGQTAIRLEALARKSGVTRLPRIRFEAIEREGMLVVGWSPLFRTLSTRANLMDDAPAYALGFHYAMCEAAVEMLEFGMTRAGELPVCLSGGVFMNRILTRLLMETLAAKRLGCRVHSLIPPNDGGIAAGQVYFAKSVPQL